MTLPPHAPWTLQGDAVALLARQRSPGAPLPDGLAPLFGPSLVAAVSYADSPVGPYRELVVARPARMGARIGLCATTMVVTSADSRVGGRLNWGFPKELGTLRWTAKADEAELVWEERDVVIRGRAHGPGIPLVLPLRAVQRRTDGPVLVPGSLRGRVRLARVEVTVEGRASAPEFDGLTGEHRGLLMMGFRLVIRPARQPVGLRATLRAPLRAPEPALSSNPD